MRSQDIRLQVFNPSAKTTLILVLSFEYPSILYKIYLEGLQYSPFSLSLFFFFPQLFICFSFSFFIFFLFFYYYYYFLFFDNFGFITNRHLGNHKKLQRGQMSKRWWSAVLKPSSFSYFISFVLLFSPFEELSARTSVNDRLRLRWILIFLLFILNQPSVKKLKDYYK